MDDRVRTLEDDLILIAYDDLRRLARSKLRHERPDHTLQATALVHEVYCRLRDPTADIQWQGHEHFFAVAAEVMRRVLVEHARRKLAVKRGGGSSRLPLDDLVVEFPMDPGDLLDVHEALDRLATENSLAAELVKLRIFGGFCHNAAAALLGIQKGKADRVWAYAKARLYVLMTEQSCNDTARTAEGSV